jgi:hypothetical protein
MLAVVARTILGRDRHYPPVADRVRRDVNRGEDDRARIRILVFGIEIMRRAPVVCLVRLRV